MKKKLKYMQKLENIRKKNNNILMHRKRINDEMKQKNV